MSSSTADVYLVLARVVFESESIGEIGVSGVGQSVGTAYVVFPGAVPINTIDLNVGVNGEELVFVGQVPLNKQTSILD